MNRPLYWSIRREIWENRSIYVAPLIVAGIVLFASSINTAMTLPRKMRGLAAPKEGALFMPFSMIAAVIIFTALVVGFFYSLDALYGERRDRSILFWKSLPVSDRTTLVSKAAIPMVVLPLFACLLAFAAQVMLLWVSTGVLMSRGINPAELWSRIPLIQNTIVMFYGVAAHALWFAPLYSWVLLVSAWARRAVLLWAVLPFFAIAFFEYIAFRTSFFPNMIKYRFQGAMLEAFAMNKAGNDPVTSLSQLRPINFLFTPGLWVGLLFAWACLAAAERLRRNREPI